jgi:hypothetical protein
MKLKLLLISLLFLSIFTSAQNEKGRFFVETGVKLFGDGDYKNFVGKTGFTFYKSKWATYNNDGSLWQEGYYNNFSWAVAPRLGYSVSNRIKTGIDFQYYQSNLSYGYNFMNWTSGLFFRFNFNDRKIRPFIELGSGLGLSNMAEERNSPGGADYQSIEKQKLFYYSGSAGLTFVLSGNLNINLSARIQNTLGEEIKDNGEGSISYITEKYEYLEIVPMLSVSYFFKSKTKTQE